MRFPASGLVSGSLGLLLLVARPLPSPAPPPPPPVVEPAPAPRPLKVGIASYYAAHFHGRRTASGTLFDHRLLTAAHRTLPFGTRLRLSARGRTVEVVVNDRGPWISGRDLDLSRAAAVRLGMLRDGLLPVVYEVL